MKKEGIGYWKEDKNGLPCFAYTGDIPYEKYLPNGQRVKLPVDPWFLLGNYQLTLFTHVSGEYELITGQRSWGRVNQGISRNSGANKAAVKVWEQDGNAAEYCLTGMDSKAADPDFCERVFGCGFADYTYKLNNIVIERNISVKPSKTPYDGASAFLLSVKIKNTGTKEVKAEYLEAVLANYKEIQYQGIAEEKHVVQYTYENKADIDGHMIMTIIKGHAKDPLLFSRREDMSKYEGFPPAVFIQAIEKEWILDFEDKNLTARAEVCLAPGEESILHLLIGFTFEYGVSSIANIREELLGKREFAIEEPSAYAADWKNVLPEFEEEGEKDFKQELIWHAYNLHAMATFSEYYQETKIPQGPIYDYDWGNHASARDNFQHGLPLIYYAPELARSVLRYMMKRTTPYGEIRLIEKGSGYCSAERYFTSDQQLFFFLMMGEYLRVTGDYGFLSEVVETYPVQGQTGMPVLGFIKQCFLFLRDEISTGEHGLVRLLNSDWNDAVYYIVNAPYNNVLFTGESHMNSAMAVFVLQALIAALKEAGECDKLCDFKDELLQLAESMSLYRESVWEAFRRDMGERKFPRRMYFAGKAYGEDNMFLEPQGYTLLINEFPVERKKALYEEMRRRVYDGEKLGARQQQTPEFEDPEFDKGSRENGGFWWALNGPVIMGVADFDKEEANRLLRNMTFANYSREFPEYWSSYWSAADNVESSLIMESGLPDQSLAYSDIPVYCAHPHAWILYCYYYLNE